MMLYFTDPLSAGFHVFALSTICGGLAATNPLREPAAPQPQS